MSDKAQEAVDTWLKFKKEQPKLALALSVLPVSGQITAAAEYYDAMQRGDTADGVLAAMQFIPGGGVAKGAKLAAEAARDMRSAKTWAQVARLPPPAGMTAQRASEISLDMVARNHAAAATNAATAVGAASTDVANVADYFKNTGQWAAATGNN